MIGRLAIALSLAGSLSACGFGAGTFYPTGTPGPRKAIDVEAKRVVTLRNFGVLLGTRVGYGVGVAPEDEATVGVPVNFYLEVNKPVRPRLSLGLALGGSLLEMETDDLLFEYQPLTVMPVATYQIKPGLYLNSSAGIAYGPIILDTFDAIGEEQEDALGFQGHVGLRKLFNISGYGLFIGAGLQYTQSLSVEIGGDDHSYGMMALMTEAIWVL